MKIFVFFEKSPYNLENINENSVNASQISVYEYDLNVKVNINNAIGKYYFMEKYEFEIYLREIVDTSEKEHYYDNSILINELGFNVCEKNFNEFGEQKKFQILKINKIYLTQNYQPK